MTPAQEDMALRSCHPLYREWCEEGEDSVELESEPDVDIEPDMDWEVDLGEEI